MIAMVIGAEERRRAAEIVAWSKAHPYQLSELRPCGAGETHAMVLFGGVRCVFSITLIEGVRYRHLSMSQGERKRYVHPRLARAIAIELFGFTSHARAEPDPTWIIGLSECEHAVVVIAQPEETPS